MCRWNRVLYVIVISTEVSIGTLLSCVSLGAFNYPNTYGLYYYSTYCLQSYTSNVYVCQIIFYILILKFGYNILLRLFKLLHGYDYMTNLDCTLKF